MEQSVINDLIMWYIDNIGTPPAYPVTGKAEETESQEPSSYTEANWNWFFQLRPIGYYVEYANNKDIIWVHATDGSTVGRFGKNGVDIHTTVSEQMAGKGQCRLCTHRASTSEDLALFINKAAQFWGVDVDKNQFNLELLG